MQRGFATLEIIFITLIIAVLATVTVPNISLLLDRVQLDYETKRLYTQMRNVQSFDRIANMRDNHFGIADVRSTLTLVFRTDKGIISTYLIENIDSSNGVYETYSLPKGFTFSFEGSGDFSYIRFDDMGKPRGKTSYENPRGKMLDGHIKINSRRNKDFFIYVTTVGRISTDIKRRY